MTNLLLSDGLTVTPSYITTVHSYIVSRASISIVAQRIWQIIGNGVRALRAAHTTQVMPNPDNLPLPRFYFKFSISKMPLECGDVN